MGMDDRDPSGFPGRKEGSGPRARGLTLRLVALGLSAFMVTAAVLALARWLGHGGQPAQAGVTASASTASTRLFRTWPADRKPEVVVLLSGEQHGYLQPCGCSRPQLGGLERRYNFVQSLIRDHGWTVVAGDLGDLAQAASPQTLLKYHYSMEGLKRLGYTATGIGLNEMKLPLMDALAAFALDNPSPRVLAANLLNRDVNFPGMTDAWKVSDAKGMPRVGFVGAVGKIVAGPAERHDRQSLRFDPVDHALPAVLQALQAQSPDLSVLLLQGSAIEAKALAGRFPEFRIIQCLTREEEPPDKPEMVGDTVIIELGHKGRYVGLVGAFRPAGNGPLELHYQLVPMAEEYETPEGKDDQNPELGLLEEYARKVKEKNYLAEYPKIPHPDQNAFKGATYVGSAACQKCHPHAYQVWQNSPHSHAYDTLTKAKRPSLRQYDGECIKCHVVGFDYQGGFTDEVKTAFLKDNGCENCHGPGSLHVKGNKTPALLAAMNPFKTQPNETSEQKAQRINRLDQSCQKCHDIDNDVHWKIKKWDKIVHPTPAEEK